MHGDLLPGLDVTREPASLPGFEDDRSASAERDALLVGESQRRDGSRSPNGVALLGPGTALVERDPGSRRDRAPHEGPGCRGLQGNHDQWRGEPDEREPSAQRGQPDPGEVGQQDRNEDQEGHTDRRRTGPTGDHADLARGRELGPDEQSGDHHFDRSEEGPAASGFRPARPGDHGCRRHQASGAGPGGAQQEQRDDRATDDDGGRPEASGAVGQQQRRETEPERG